MSDLSTGPLQAGEPDPEPIRRTVAGVELVTIPLDHYAELLRCRRLAHAFTGQGEKSERGRVRPSTLDEDDPEGAAHLRDCFARGLSIERSLLEYARRFGRQVSFQKARSLWHKVRSES